MMKHWNARIPSAKDRLDYLFGLIDIEFNNDFAFKQDGSTRGHNYYLVSNGRFDARWDCLAVKTILHRNPPVLIVR